MTKLNVVDLGAFKDLRELRKSVASFEKYLKGLTNMQLEVEVNHLMDNSKEEKICSDFFSKSQMILKEISSRVHPAVKTKIDEMRTER